MGSDRRPVIYAGRSFDRVAGADLPGDCIVLGEQDALPHKLAGVLDRASALVILDLASFPLEAMADERSRSAHSPPHQDRSGSVAKRSVRLRRSAPPSAAQALSLCCMARL